MLPLHRKPCPPDASLPGRAELSQRDPLASRTKGYPLVRSTLLLEVLAVTLVIVLNGCGRIDEPDASSTKVTELAFEPSRAGPTVPLAPPRSPMSASVRMAALRGEPGADGYDFVTQVDGSWRARVGRSCVTSFVELREDKVTILPTLGNRALSLFAVGVGRAGNVEPLPSVVGKSAAAQGLTLEREDGLQERYLSGPVGLEQSLVLKHRPAGIGALSLVVRFEGLTPHPATGSTDGVRLRDHQGRERGGYRDLAAMDATGRTLDAHMEVRGQDVALVVEDEGAAYPLLIDPLVFVQTEKLSADDAAIADSFGFSVAVDEDTAIVGAYNKASFDGAAYLFHRSGVTWTQQQKLTLSDAENAGGEYFGWSVAVHGNTAVVARVNDTPGGAVYVFTRSEDTWTLQQKLTASQPAIGDLFGGSVAIDENTIVVGATEADVGSVYVFARSNEIWSLQQKVNASLSTSRQEFGGSVAIRGDTLLVGAAHESSWGSGAAYIFTRAGNIWTEQQTLTSSDSSSNTGFGHAVAMADDTALISAPNSGGGGAVYVFRRSGVTWTQQQELTGVDGPAQGGFGSSVALRGTSALVGASGGVAYAFMYSGSTWVLQASTTVGDTAVPDGTSVAVAIQDSTAFVGASRASGTGAVFLLSLKSTQGDPCAASTDCASAFCVEGICCDTICDQDCFSCEATFTGVSPGTCAPVKAGVSDPHTACLAGDPPCGADGLCDGAGSCRLWAPASTPCGSKSCEGASVVTHQCDGNWICEKIEQPTCEPYVCDSTSLACSTTCASTADCTSGATCADGQCTFAVDGSAGTHAGPGSLIDAAPTSEGGGCSLPCPSRRSPTRAAGLLALTAALYLRRSRSARSRGSSEA